MANEPHPDAQGLLTRMAELDAPAIHTLAPPDARRAKRDRSLPPAEYEPERVRAVRDIVVRGPGHGIPVRAYEPPVEEPAPPVVWAHGGGWVVGDIETEDATARALTNAAGRPVLSVEYRLSPEHPFPAALEDVLAVTEWASENAAQVRGIPGPVAVGGASSGGTLAAAAALVARDQGEPAIGYQVLAYPLVNYDRAFDSRETYDGYFLSLESLQWFTACYLEHELHGRNPYAFPIEACDLAGLPPATVVTAGFDPLRDEGRAYAKRLADAEVTVTHREYDDMIHAFLGNLGDAEWERARNAIDAIGSDLRDHTHG